MKFKIIILLLSVVLVAGCTNMDIPNLDLGGSSIGGGSGLEITSFTAEPSTVYTGAKVRVTMDIENLGGISVPKSQAIAFLTGTNVELGGDGRYWTSSADIAYKQVKKNEMRPNDVVRGTPADTDRLYWSLTAPTDNIAAGQTRTDTFYGRLYCNYQTSVNGNVWVYTEGESESSKSSGISINRASFTSSKGPVSLSVKASPDPVITYSDNEPLSLYITITNTGGGVIYKKKPYYATSAVTIPTADYNQVDINVEFDDTKMTLENSADCIATQDLPSGKSTTVVCEFTVDTPSNFESYPITVTADYGYYTQKTVSVTVQGKSGTNNNNGAASTDCTDADGTCVADQAACDESCGTDSTGAIDTASECTGDAPQCCTCTASE
jgi:hypothetical protein